MDKPRVMNNPVLTTDNHFDIEYINSRYGFGLFNNAASRTNSFNQRLRQLAKNSNLFSKYVSAVKGVSTSITEFLPAVNSPSMQELITDGFDESIYQHVDGGIAGLSRDAACVVDWTGHGLVNGEEVWFELIEQAGWTALNGNSYVITKINDNQFSVPVNTSGYPADYNAGTDPGRYYKRRIFSSYAPASTYACLKFANTAFLDWLLGTLGNNGFRADGSKSWVLNAHLWESYVKLLFHDNGMFASYSGYSGVDADELLYATAGAMQDSYYNYLSAWKSRILDPYGIEMIINQGSCPYNATPTHRSWFDIMSLADGIYTESLLFSDILSTLVSWYSSVYWSQDIYHYLIKVRWCIENEKIVAISDFHLRKVFRIAKTVANVYTYQTVSQSDGVKLVIIKDGAPINYVLGNYTIGTLIAQIATDYGADLTLDYTNCNPYFLTASALVLERMGAAQTIAAATTYEVNAYQWPRLSLLTLLACIWLAAPSQSSRVFIVPGSASGNITGGGLTDCDLYLALALLGEPDFVIQPKENEILAENYPDYTGQITWSRLEASKDIFYRVFDNGVVFLNWEDLAGADDPYVINSNDARWGSKASWYPLSDAAHNLLTPNSGLTATSAVNISLPAKRGDICLFTW